MRFSFVFMTMSLCVDLSSWVAWKTLCSLGGLQLVCNSIVMVTEMGDIFSLRHIVGSGEFAVKSARYAEQRILILSPFCCPCKRIERKGGLRLWPRPRKFFCSPFLGQGVCPP